MQKLNRFIEEITGVFDKRLKSIFIYGSKAGSESPQHETDLNLMIIVESLTGEDLKNCFTPVRRWTGEASIFDRNKNPMPVFMGEKEWFNSADVYAMEYTDIKENHKILYGEDLICGIDIKKEDLRLQCEAEAKNLLMRFRGHYLMNSRCAKSVGDSFIPLVKTLNAIFKAVLRLKDLEVSVLAGENLGKVCEMADLDREFFEKLLCAKERRCGFSKKETYAMADMAVIQLQKLLEFVNNL